MCLHNDGRREVAALGSMCCIRVLSFWVQAISEQPFSLQGQTMCSTASMCVMNETGTFFFWPCFPYRREDQYSAIQNGGWRLTVSLPLSTPFLFDQGLDLVLIDVFIIDCPHNVLSCIARHLAKGGLVYDVCFSIPCLFFFQYMHKLTLYFILYCLNAQMWQILSVLRNLAQWFMFALKLMIALAILTPQKAFEMVLQVRASQAVSLLFSGLLYLAALDCTYPHYLWFSSPQRKKSISLKTFSSALAVPLKDFAVLFR